MRFLSFLLIPFLFVGCKSDDVKSDDTAAECAGDTGVDTGETVDTGDTADTGSDTGDTATDPVDTGSDTGSEDTGSDTAETPPA